MLSSGTSRFSKKKRNQFAVEWVSSNKENVNRDLFEVAQVRGLKCDLAGDVSGFFASADLGNTAKQRQKMIMLDNRKAMISFDWRT